MSSKGMELIILGLMAISQVYLARGAPHLRADDFSLVLLHNNDMHGRFEETESNSGTCQKDHRNNTCIGGMARTAHVVRSFKEQEAQGGPPVLFLNAGDTFVGTTWFSVFTWNISSAFMNLLKPDAISLGNHEFDLTDVVLASFIDHLTPPILAANLDFSQTPSLNGKIKPSIILNVQDKQVGIIGYLTPETLKISNVGNVTFEDEVIAIKREAEALAARGVNIIIALGHSGYVMDQTIAREVDLVDVVIGGHTNTFLWNGEQPDSEFVEGPYPQVVTQVSGKKVPVVQAYAYTKYLGVLNCTFDNKGDLTSFAGQPILLESKIPQETELLQLLEVYRPAIDALSMQVIGQSRVLLDGDNWRCRHEECNFGNLITDGLVHYALTETSVKWTNVPIGLYNGGGIRNSITPHPVTGDITRGDLIAVLPFGNQVIQLTLRGSDLLYAIEQMVRSNGETSLGEFPQVSGLKVTLNMSQPAYSRVHSLKVRCGTCEIPDYEPLDVNKNYTLVTSSFLADGGDGITTLKEKALEKITMDLGDLDAVANYITKYSPIYSEIEGRIRFVNGTSRCGNSSGRIGFTWSLLVLALMGRSLLKLIIW
ncbi:protein 5NUC-like isoform X2 [Euwallacea fornicatus]|uniref:protein 5NUC-like isoform X2 n=1 Tax=Euwallacea fornicatus TaxID=995702 RepID=UPI00338EC559